MLYERRTIYPLNQYFAVDVSESLKEHKIEMVIVENTVEAAEHAAGHGLIFTETIPAIEQEKKEDKGQEPGKEDPTVL